MRQHLFILLMALLCALPAAAKSGTIAGTVYDEQHHPVPGVSITALLGGSKAAGSITDKNGKYAIHGMSAAHKYELRVQHPSYRQMLLRNIIVQDGKTTYQNFTLQPIKGNTGELAVKDAQKPMLLHDEQGRATKSIGIQEIAGASAAGAPAEHKRPRSTRRRTAAPEYQYAPPPRQPIYLNPSEESYAKVRDNDFMTVRANPLSTLSVDVDRASYSNVRRFINEGQKPPADAVRVEEMINYFHYNYPQPREEDPIAITTELTDCPWNEQHQLLRVGLQARTIPTRHLPPSNLVFLIDVSGSMASANKLPLVKSSLRMLVGKLRARDRVSIVVYAGSAGLVLPSTPGSDKETISSAIDRLEAGGSTAGGAGIKLAYKVAMENFEEGGNNRVILATDGDFNVGISADNELESLITRERKKGIFLTCLGYGMGNYKDAKLETLADKGNGNYAYIDTRQEAEKTLVTEFGGTLFTIAKDVKAQIEFNPSAVQAYRLVGYENRLLNEEDFEDDKKDAGEMGSGHQVTMLYELVPAGIRSKHVRRTTDLRYQQREISGAAAGNELATVKFRYKQPDGHRSSEMAHVIRNRPHALEHCTEDTRFASSVALFGMLLRNSRFAKEGDMRLVLNLARSGKGEDEQGYRQDFINLVKQANTTFSFND